MDQSMICLPSDVKTALEKTSFIKRYEMLSNTFNGERTPLNERLRYIDGEIVLDSWDIKHILKARRNISGLRKFR